MEVEQKIYNNSQKKKKTTKHSPQVVAGSEALTALISNMWPSGIAPRNDV